jgi:hypothetical protein
MAATLDLDTLAWLASLGPRAELTMRIALRDRFDHLCADRAFSARVKLLLDLINPRPPEMAKIMADARAVENGRMERAHPEPSPIALDAPAGE